MTRTRIGIIGTRHVHAGGLAEGLAGLGAEVVGAVEPDGEAAAGWSASPVVELDELLGSVDAVVVAGTNRERTDAVIAATRAGLPTLAEKPIGMSADDLERLLGPDGADPALVMVALPLRFSAGLQRARELVQAGALGTPLAARGQNRAQFPGGWFGEAAEAGGGALQDHVVHLSDGLCWMLDDTATRVYARTSRALHPQLDVEDCGIVTLDFAGGIFASIDSSWSRPASFPTWGDVWLEVVGSGGRIRLDPMSTHVELYDDGAGSLRHVPYSDDDMSRAMLQAFLAFARDGGPSPVPLAEAVHASDTVLAAYASAASGRPEPIVSR